MPLIVEDGTGLADAEAYASVVEFKAYCDGRGLSYAAAPTDADIEKKLRLSAEFIDGRYRFKGVRLTITQALEFPRSGLIDWSSQTITGLPKRVKHVAIALAQKAITDPVLFADSGKAGWVRSETVGPISKTYGGDGADPTKKVFGIADALLAPYLYAATSSMTGPSYGGSDDAYFSFDMHENASA